MKKTWKNILMNVAVPIIIGAVLYYLFCPDTIFVRQIDEWLGVSKHLYPVTDHFIYQSIRNYLFDFLWAYAMMSAAILLFGADFRNRYRLAGIIIFFEIFMELLQLLPDIAGTYDIFDLVVEGIANVLVIKNSGGDRNEKS